GAAAAAQARDHTLILVRPDAIASRKAHMLLDWLPAHGFRLSACVALSIDRHQVRSLWQYQWNAAPREYRDACDALMDACPSLLLVIANEAPLQEAASLRFSRLMGAADPAMRCPHDLRVLPGQPSRMPSLLHAPDEAADFVREIAILLPERQRKALFAGMLGGTAMPVAEAQAEVSALYGRVAEHSLDLHGALARVAAAVDTVAASNTEGRQVLLDHPPREGKARPDAFAADQGVLIDQRFGSPIPGGLTEIADKATLYAIDTCFREGWEDLVAMAGDAATGLAFGHSMMLVKPDALVSHRLDVVLDWLPRHDFEVVAGIPVTVSPDQAKALWRYQFNCAPRIRKDAYMALFEASPSLLLVVRSTQDPHVSAAKRLANLKGPADPSLQRADNLRAWLGNVTHLLSFVHAADEPADLVRELAILLPTAQRKAVHARMSDGVGIPVRELRAIAAGICQDMPRHSLALPEAVARIEKLALAAAGMSAADRETVAAFCERVGTGAAADWRVLFDLLDDRGIRYDRWDRITIAAHTSDVVEPHLEPLLPGAVPLTDHA
ncbi:MAG TPA: nucleoside-diphosphate kinase, partial [Pseudoduganella sp.]